MKKSRLQQRIQNACLEGLKHIWEMKESKRLNKNKKLKDYLVKLRNPEELETENEAIIEDGFFNAEKHSGGNFHDCYYMGKSTGRAEIIEEILLMMK